MLEFQKTSTRMTVKTYSKFFRTLRYRNSFHCELSGEFVSILYKCDYKKDCLDGSDEKDCLHEELGFFICDQTRKLSLIYICDFINQCQDKTDELNCCKYYFLYFYY